MKLVDRCHYCRRFVWPWQSQGWIVGVMRWHGRCGRRAVAGGGQP